MVITEFYKSININNSNINISVLAPKIINHYPFNQAYPANNFFDLNAVISGNNYLPAFYYSGVNFYDTELQDFIGKENALFNFFNYDSIHGTMSNTVNNFKLFSYLRDKPQPYYGTSYSYSTAPNPSDCIANVQITKLNSPPDAAYYGPLITQNYIISNICFPANTPIKTDQGIISIENINPKIHTIHKDKISALTKTISCDKYLICFQENSLGKNYPCQKTTMTKNHKILFQGKMREAYTFLGRFNGVKKVEYNRDILYNILMENYDVINVNNLICETLDPVNFIAKLYNSPFNEDYKDKLIVTINDSLKRKDYSSYKKAISIISV
jgi:hypothetical protein